MCILGEPTDMHVVLEHFGSMWVRISCTGIYVHTAFCEGREEMNSIRRMYELMETIMKWIANWEKNAAHGGKKALVNLGGIRGGHAWRASRTPEKTDLFLDVRVPPTIPMNDARRNVQADVPRTGEEASRLGPGVRDLCFGARRAHQRRSRDDQGHRR